MKSGNLNFLQPSGPLQAWNGIALPFAQKFSSYLTENNVSITKFSKLQ